MWSNNVETDLSITPVVYFKAALGLLAVYNTQYTQDMVSYSLSKISSSSGFNAGITENGHIVGSSGDVRNSVVLSAARYAIKGNVSE